MIGIAALVLIGIGVAILRALYGALDLWWLRRQKPASPPAYYESRVWAFDCPRVEHRVWHPAHRWTRNAWTAGGRPTGHPNHCAGYAGPPTHA